MASSVTNIRVSTTATKVGNWRDRRSSRGVAYRTDEVTSNYLRDAIRWQSIALLRLREVILETQTILRMGVHIGLPFEQRFHKCARQNCRNSYYNYEVVHHASNSRTVLIRFRAVLFGVVSSGAVGAMDLYEFVVEAKDEERCGPLANEEGLMLSSRTEGQEIRPWNQAQGQDKR